MLRTGGDGRIEGDEEEMTSKSVNVGKIPEKKEKPSHQNNLVAAEELAEEILSDRQQVTKSIMTFAYSSSRLWISTNGEM